MEANEKATRQGLRIAHEAAEQTEKVLEQTEQATREDELTTAVFGALKTTHYDELTVDEISKRLDDLSTEELRRFASTRRGTRTARPSSSRSIARSGTTRKNITSR